MLNNNYRTCPSCNQVFMPTDESVELEVEFNSINRSYIYCGTPCYSKAVSKLILKDEIAGELEMEESIVSEDPIKYKILFKVKTEK